VSQKKRVLVIDDEASSGNLIAACCDAWGLEAVVTTSPGEALDIAADGRAPDVSLTDFMMPRMNGHEFILAVRKNPKLRRIPVVLMSAAPDAALRGSPADAFIAKPLDLDERSGHCGSASTQELDENHQDTRLEVSAPVFTSA
jgi:CheY-like chemotaxis protein